MRRGLYIFAIFFIAFGFQAGIASSAASAVKFGGWKKICVTMPADATGGADILTPETPWPSCKSMVTADGFDHDLSAQALGSSPVTAGDASPGFWRILGIDEPPKAI